MENGRPDEEISSVQGVRYDGMEGTATIRER